MAGTDGAEYGLRTRVKEDRRPLSHLSNKELGHRAAGELINGTLNTAEALQKYHIDRHCLSYYKKKLEAMEYHKIVAAATPAGATAGSTPATGEGLDKATTNVDTAASDEWTKYCEAYIQAGQLIANRGMSQRRAARFVFEKTGIAISPSTARRASERPGEPPSKPGRQVLLGLEVESKLEMLVLVMREMKIPIFMHMILTYANKLIQGTELEEQFKHSEVRKHWYYNWLGRCQRLKTGNIRPLEVTRAKWATAEHARRHYEILAELMVELKIAVTNPDFDEEVPMSEVVKIVKPGRIFSMDETRLTNDTTAMHKGKQNRSLLAKEGDDGTTHVNKGGGDGTGIGGSGVDGLDLPAFFIFALDILHAGSQNDDVAVGNRPVCRRADPATGKPLECRFWANKKGGVTGDLGVRWIRGCLQPAVPDISPENPAILIMDGHGSHFTLELLSYCRAIGLHVVLRPPHTTHLLQGEDVQHFAVFKPLYQQKKLLAVNTKLLSGTHRLTVGDLLHCAKDAWERAFDLNNCLKAWEKIGVSPFTRKVYWDLLAAEEQREKVAKQAAIDPQLLTIEGMVRVCFPDVKHPGAAKAAKKDKVPGEMANLHSTDFWDKKGGVTADECYEMVKAKTEANQAKLRRVEQRKNERAEKRKNRHASANQLGSELSARLASEADIKRLKVDELKAVLTFKGVPFETGTKKADLSWLLSLEMKDSFAQPFVAATSNGCAGTSGDAGDADAGEGSGSDSESSEWPHSEADDH